MTETSTAHTAAWHPDPVGRHVYRYHDGVQWTDLVSDHGQISSDALPQTVDARGVNAGAVVSLVLALAWMAGITSVLAIFVGVGARRQIRQSGQSGDGLAAAGILLGVLGTMVGIGWLVVIGQSGS